ncbi:hypothetical protein DL768_008364 [Monosporascus sp. mg162]|nr:hypothetical protein DL768_008364 [Monosporascus sp. mg162]
MPRDGSTTLVTAVSQMPMHGDQTANVVKPRQVTLTQTLTNAGSTSTAIVTLDRGGPPTEAPPPPDRGPWDSGGLPPRTVGVIVGCSVGGLFLILLIYCCCIAAYRRRGGTTGSGTISLVDTPANSASTWPDGIKLSREATAPTMDCQQRRPASSKDRLDLEPHSTTDPRRDRRGLRPVLGAPGIELVTEPVDDAGSDSGMEPASAGPRAHVWSHSGQMVYCSQPNQRASSRCPARRQGGM